MFMFFVSFHVILCFIYTMTKKNNSFTPNKHVPKGFTILYEDIDIIVINKNPGLLTIVPRGSEYILHIHFLPIMFKKEILSQKTEFL